MLNLIPYFKKKPHFLILGLILFIGLTFRTYKIVEWLEFAHDADLYSWIVKDIVVNHHPRLIGQLTSAPGIFIGPIFYYLLVPFFILTKMDPVGAILLTTLIGVLTILSFYFVFSKLFNKQIGLIATFLQAVLITNINYDRWVVPTNPVKLWAVWYFYTIFMLARGNFSVLPILAILIGLIWSIHIALLPALAAVPLALLVSRKLPNLKNVALFLIILLITSSPFLVFEFRHGFSQIRSLTHNFNMSFDTVKQISSSKTYHLLPNNSVDNSYSQTTGSDLIVIDLTPVPENHTDHFQIHIYSKNPKFSTLKINLGCGNPSKYEIGSSDAKFIWSTNGCVNENQTIEVTSRANMDPFWWKIISSFEVVLEKLSKNISDLFLTPLSLTKPLQLMFTLVFFFSSVFVIRKNKYISFKEFIPLLSWILGLLIFFTFSSIIISEYYLTNVEIIFTTIVTLAAYKIYSAHVFGKYLLFLLACLILLNTYFFFKNNNPYKKGYLERKATVEYIKNDATLKQYPCVGISYLTSRGENVGFRYFFYLNNVHLVHSSLKVPVYNIVIPDELSNEVKQKFGHIGVIPPTNIPSKEVIDKSCQTPDTNLTDSVLGYVD